jgi:hypothetical protein
MTKTFYKTYADIPVFTKEYIEIVADVKNVMEIPLEDINSFLQGLADFHKKVSDEYDDLVL